jgi:hypothetical protein
VRQAWRAAPILLGAGEPWSESEAGSDWEVKVL